MKDIELPPLPEPKNKYPFPQGNHLVQIYGYTREEVVAYARAAVEADRAQRVPVVSVRDAVTKSGPLWEKFCAVYETYCGRQITIREIAWRCFLAASTPAHPAQQEPPQNGIKP